MRIMKRVRKLLSGVIVLSLLLSLATVGFAEDTTEPVTASADAGTPSASQTVNGNVTVSAEGSAVSASATATEGGTAEVTVNGSASSSATPNSGDYAYAAGLSAETHEGGTANATATGTVSATVTGGDTAYANGVVVETGYPSSAGTNGGSATATAGGDVSATVTTSGENANAAAVSANQYEGGSTAVSVTGNATASASAASTAYAEGVHSQNANSVSVTGNASATASDASNSTAYGVGVIDAGTVTVGGDVSAAASSSSSAQATGVFHSYVDGQDNSQISVAGNVTSSASTNGTDSSENTRSWSDGMVIFTSEEGSVDVTVGGDISATATGGSEIAYAQGINADAQTGGGSGSGENSSSITIHAGGDVTASASTTGEHADAGAVTASGHESSNINITIDGDVSSSSTGPEAGATGVFAAYGGGTITVTVNGDVTTSAKGDSTGSLGLYNAPTDNQNSQITVSGDVTSTGNGGDDSVIRSVDDYVDSGNGTITIGGNVTAEGTEGFIAGIDAYSYSSESTADVSVGGEVTATATNGESTDTAIYGVRPAAIDGGTTNVSVDGDVTVSTGDGNFSTGYGVYAYSSGDSSLINLDIGGAVSSESRDDTAVYLYLDGGTVVLNAGDDVSSSSQGISRGIIISAENGSTAEVAVDGDVSADAYTTARGIAATAADGSSVSVSADGVSVSSSQVSEYQIFGTESIGVTVSTEDQAEATVKIGENGITSTGQMSVGAWLDASGGTSNLEVAGDVTADGYGIFLSEYTNLNASGTGAEAAELGVIDVLVEGTVSGGTSSIYLLDSETEQDIKLTVWKAELNDENRVVTGAAWSNGADSDEVEQKNEAAKAAAQELEANILYIIKLEQPDASQGSVTLAGVVDSHGFDTAKEGDIVTLKTMVQEGYQLVGAFNGIDTKTSLMQDADGNYYLVVPKGGGVYLSVQLEKIETTPVTPVTPTVDPTPATPFVFPLNWPIYNLPVVQPGILAQVGTIPSLRGYDIDLRRSLITGSYYLMTPRDGSRVPSALLEELANEVEEMEGVDGVGIVLKFKQAKPSGADEKLVLEAIGDKTVAAWLDASAVLQGTGAKTGKMLLQVAVPDDILTLAKQGAAFEVYHVENGKAVGTPAVYNPDTETIDFETDFIGMFALVYSKAVAAGV